MRPALVLGMLALAFVARIVFGPGPQGTFDDRFKRAERELEEMSQNIDAELSDDLERSSADK